MNKLERKFDQLARALEREADKAMAEARTKYVIPFCDRTGMRFIAGMGSWSFDKPGCESIGSWNSEDLPKRLRDVLTVEYPIGRCDAGSLMADYTPKNYKG